MFTGIIEELGTIVDLTPSGTSLCLKIEAEQIFSEGLDNAKTSQNGLKIGDSIAVNGVCLTATKVQPRMIGHTLPYFEVTVVEETLGKTTFGSLIVRNEDKASTIGAMHMMSIVGDAGHAVNLERAATLETRLGGHLVQGHVDGVATIRNIRDANGSWEFSFDIPREMARFIVPKGSIAIEGISLTVASVIPTPNEGGGQGVVITVAIIPHTYYHTTFQFLKMGDTVNVELDIIAKMVERLVKPYVA
jgi:riboflavin synthase